MSASSSVTQRWWCVPTKDSLFATVQDDDGFSVRVHRLPSSGPGAYLGLWYDPDVIVRRFIPTRLPRLWVDDELVGVMGPGLRPCRVLQASGNLFLARLSKDNADLPPLVRSLVSGSALRVATFAPGDRPERVYSLSGARDAIAEALTLPLHLMKDTPRGGGSKVALGGAP